MELIPTLLGVSLITFLMLRFTPGDPVKMMLGPEATQEGIDAKSVELGFKKYVRGEGSSATLERDGAGGLLRTTGHSDSITSGTKVTLHIGAAIHPVGGLAQRDGTGLYFLLAKTDLEAGPHTVSANRELVKQNVILHYLQWLGGVLRGDLGTSLTSKRPVWDEIRDRMPATIELAVASMVFAVITGLIVGVLSAVYPRSLIDSASRLFVFVFLAMPSFWLGLELIILFSRKLPWFPPAGRDGIMSLVLPAITLGVGTGAFLCRILRSSMLQVLNLDYIRTARAKGLDGKRVILKHALKNAMIPFITVAGISLGALLGGAVIVETVFAWPGIGKLMVDSIGERNFPVTMGCVLVLATIFVLVNMAVDMLYVLLDPRIRLDGGGA